MEFVGRAVTVARVKLGGEISSGTVRSYDASSGLCVVLFDGGDSEELGLSEVSAALSPSEEGEGEGGGGVQLGRKRKKRRYHPEPGNDNVVSSGLSDETLVEGGGLANGVTEGNLGMGIGGNSNLKEIGIDETLERVSEACLGENGVEGLGNGLDLNAGFNLNLNDELSFLQERNSRKRGRIDLNLDANGDFDEALNSPVEMKRMGCKFDLNLDVVEDVKEDEDVSSNGTLTKVDLDINAKIVEKLENLESNECVGAGERLDNGLVVSGDEDLKPLESHLMSGPNSVNDGDLIDVEVKDDVSEAAETPIVNGQLDKLASSPVGQRSSRRKRKKLLDLDIENTPTQPVLRRSARRGSAASRVSINETPSSPPASAITEEKMVISARKELEKSSVSIVVPPPKLQLPPSSQNLDLSNMPILDIFSIYACLRSFSTLLFLSPFELEDFVGALKCESPNPLFNNVHVAILRILRKHMEFLSAEGSVSASDCLRSINWDFLDVITWPVLMVEYFLIHDSELKPRFNISSLKLFKADYCQQPASVKIEILRCLCDDLIEVEAMRSELNRRSMVVEPEMGLERNSKLHVGKRRRASVGISYGSYLEDEVANDTADLNYDECCLCKMDGNLICCDGCPAAYHSRCVGVAGDNLPDGNWYCPECAVDKRKPWMKRGKSLRGAELLGIDPHGRLYFHSSGYLLVSESSDSESLFSYYHKDDLYMVVEVLKLSDFYYGDILVGIFKHWGDVSFNGSNRNFDSLYFMNQSPAVSNPFVPLASEKTGFEEPGPGSDVLKSASLSDAMPVTGSSLVTSEESAETTQTQTQTCSGIVCDLNNSDKSQNKPVMDCPSTSSVHVILGAKTESIASPGQSGFEYVNHYSFGRIASSIAEDLLDKKLEKVKDDLKLAEEEIMARQMRIIAKKYPKFCWSNIQNASGDLQKEKCGWCFTCRATAEDAECLFFMYLGSVKESSISDILSLDSNKNKKSHLTDILCQILSIENRLSGLLLGPWLNPNHSKLWRKSAAKAFDIASVKHLLLMLESSISPLALSSEWLKHLDSDVSVGSASHIITSSARGKNAIGKKRPRGSDSDPGPTLNPNSGLGIFWWRGGRISRKVFNWKVLPRSMVSKAARQGGCTKIPGILYPENSEYSKRSRNVVWQAAVQTSTSAEQLAFQLRELDSNIKWDDIENTHPLPTLDKESKKSVRLFKKVIIRRKSVQGGLAKYLLDFGGKRRAIPDVVLKNGSIVDEASSEKKRYWLEESHLPIYLLKNFEEKRIARKSSNDVKSGKFIEPGRVVKRVKHNKGFAYLFSKAERSENYQCGHCSKDVLISEALSCQHCKGFFHKRHVKKSGGGPVLGECKYTCHRCQNGKQFGSSFVKIVAKKSRTGKRGEKIKLKSKTAQTKSKPASLKNGKVETRGRPKGKVKNKKKVLPAVPLRRSARKAKCLVLQKKKQRGRKKGRPVKVKKATAEKVKKATIEEKVKNVLSCKKKRTGTTSSYWLNGLHFSRKPNDERVLLFRSKRFLVPAEQSSADCNEPKCFLCDEARHSSTLNYVGCEICDGWFHADAIAVHSENIDRLIGFRCHTCCDKDPPVCPHSVIINFKSDMSQLPEIQNDGTVECAEEVSNAVQPLNELQVACS